jgi:hypothetical protein
MMVVALAGCSSTAPTKEVSAAPPAPVASEQVAATAGEPTAPQYVFDVPSLLGKSIDEIRSVLGDPIDGVQTEPTTEQIALGADEWNNTFAKSGEELLVTFNPTTRVVVDFFIATRDPSGTTSDIQHVLDVGNLTESASNYTVRPVKALMDPSVFTGVIVSQ